MIGADQMDLSRTASGSLIISINIHIYSFSINREPVKNYLADFFLPGSVARPGDVLIRRWQNGQDVAVDVTVASPLSPTYVAGAAAEAGRTLSKAYDRKMRDTAEACRTQGLKFSPLAVETLGGFHCVATDVVRRLGQALARKKGCDEREPTSQLFSRISVTLMRANAAMINSRSHDVISAEVDGAG